MYYIDGTRYDLVDGTGPVVPFTRTDWGRDLPRASPVNLVIPGPVYVVHGPVTALAWSRIDVSSRPVFIDSITQAEPSLPAPLMPGLRPTNGNRS